MNNNNPYYDILIVEKKELTRNTLKRILEQSGYSVDTAEDGKESIEKLRAGNYAYGLVITGLIMSYAGGFEVIETVKNESDIPVIVLSSVTDMRTIRECFRLQADDYIKKPYDTTALVNRIHYLIGQNEVWMSRPHSPQVQAIQHAPEVVAQRHLN